MSVDLNDPALKASTLGADAFKGVFRRHPAGVAVITTVVDGEPVGFTATSVISVSADPPLLADVTPQAATELGLAPGREVWLSVKATAVSRYETASPDR